jgi:hypothetical protein
VRHARALAAAIVLIAAVLLAGAAPAWASATDAETQLAAKFAPEIRLVDEPPRCGEGEPYVPIDVDGLFDQPTVALRGPWGGNDLVKVGPAASDLAGDLFDYHLDFPGNALDPGCTYLDWSRRLTAARPPAVYAHVTTDPDYPGQLALQYWMFYVYNDWNNLHEGDWEMIQLNFDADDPAQALNQTPTLVGYSQHEGGEKASWDDPKLQKVDGTHPVVYPADGSHANFFDSELYLGASGEQGVGCDDTRNAGLVMSPAVRTIPGDQATADSEFPWIGFQGRWGEQQPAFFNGPTGPNLKTQWIAPITWSHGWRDRAYAVPVGGVLGTRTTDFFCGAMAAGSRLLWRAVDNPLPTVVAVLAVLAAIIWALRRATWRPAAPLRLAHRRSWGQVLTAAARMYAAHPRFYLGIGLLLLPISLVITGIQALLLTASHILGVADQGAAAGFFVLVAITIGSMLTWLGLGIVQAVTARAMVEFDAGRKLGLIDAFRLAAAQGRVLWSIAIFVVVTSLLTSSVILIPFAIWFAVRWSLVVPAVVLEGRRPLPAFQRSARLVRGHWVKVATLTIVLGIIAIVLGPLVGTALILATSLPLWILNIVAGIVYVLTMPFVALATGYVYFDMRVRQELEDRTQPAVLPPEVELGYG